MKQNTLRNMVATGLLLVALFSTAAAWSLEVLYPADKTYVSRSNYLIIKGGEKPQLEGIAIEFGGAKSEILNISSPEYRAAFGDFLIVAPEFDPGQNLIKVEGYVGGEKVASATADVFFLASPGASPPQGYQPFAMHVAGREALCVRCHNMNPDPAELAADSAAANPCGSCHARRLNMKYVHGPAGVYQCTYCHLADSRPVKYRPRLQEAPLCAECHEDKIQDMRAKPFVHGPIAAGLCQVCHDPHASDSYGQLVAPVNELCLGCHEEVTRTIHVVRGVGGKSHPLQAPENPVMPGVPFTCVSCHDPHGGASSQYFQRGIASRFALCQLCHKK